MASTGYPADAFKEIVKVSDACVVEIQVFRGLSFSTFDAGNPDKVVPPATALVLSSFRIRI